MLAIFVATRPLETCWVMEYMVSQPQVNTFRKGGCNFGARNWFFGKSLANLLFLNDWSAQSV